MEYPQIHPKNATFYHYFTVYYLIHLKMYQIFMCNAMPECMSFYDLSVNTPQSWNLEINIL